MAYCVLNYHQKFNGAYIGGHSMQQSSAAAAAAADPTAVLQNEMRSLTTKDHHNHSHHHHHHHHHHHNQHQYSQSQQTQYPSPHPPSYPTTLHTHSIHLHQPHVHHPQHVHHLHSPTQSAQQSTPSSAPLSPHPHASVSSLTSNSSSSSTGFGEPQLSPPTPTQQFSTTSRNLPRNRRRSVALAGKAQFGGDNRCGQYETNGNSSSHKRYSYTNNKNESRSSSQSSRVRHDSRRGSAASSLRSTSPSSASSVSSSSSMSAANTRSPSPQTIVHSSDCQRIPSLSDASTLTVPTTVVANTGNTVDNSVDAADHSHQHGHGSFNGGQAQQVLSYDQVHRLHQVMEQVVPIHGRGNFPTLDIKLKTLVKVVRNKLESAQPPVKVRDIRLNGGAASHVLAPETGGYNDLDLIFAVDLLDQTAYDRVRSAVLDSLLEFLPTGVNRTRLSSTSLKEAYIHKMVKVTDQDRWSLISLSNNLGRNVELKFVDTMKRQFEFSVDSFHIVLDSLLLFYECSQLPISTNIYPTVIGESVYGDFGQALQHLKDKLIATRHPEQIRGGGLLKYCNLLIRGYRPAEPDNIKSLERYMCSRFFIDFNEIGQQRSKLDSYLANHFIGDDLTRTQYLIQLHKVVDDSTVCLMGYERRQTLSLIEELACNIYYQMQQQQQLQQPQQVGNSGGNATVRLPTISLPSNFKHPFIHHLQQQQVLLASGARYEASLNASDHLLRPASPSVDLQSNADSIEQEPPNVDGMSTTIPGDVCNSPNCACAAQAASICTPSVPQYHAYLLGNASNHFYYTAHFQNGYGCYNSCNCGGHNGWMTCA